MRAVLVRLGAGGEIARADRLLAMLEPTRRGRPDLGLTRREVEVLGLLAEGLSNDEIATALVVSIRTVEQHLANLYPKIGVRGRTARAAATIFAHRHGLVRTEQ